MVCAVIYEPVSSRNCLISAFLQGTFPNLGLLWRNAPGLIASFQCLRGKFPTIENRTFDVILDAAANTKSDRHGDDNIPATGPAVTQSGDLWLLGTHRIFCGNALAGTSYDNLLDGSKASLIFTDPPYNVTIGGNVGGKGEIHHREFAMGSGEMTPPIFTSFLTTTFQRLAANSLDGSIHYTCMDWRHMQEMLAAGYNVYTELKNVCVWNKSNGGMGTFYRSKHELVFVWKSGTAPHLNNFELSHAPTFGTMPASIRSVQAEWTSCKCIQP